MKKSIIRQEMADQEIAVLAMEEAEYQQLLRGSKPFSLHPTWAAYCVWLEQCVQKGIACSWPIQVQHGTAVEVQAFCWATKRDLDTTALCAYAVHLSRRETGNT